MIFFLLFLILLVWFLQQNMGQNALKRLEVSIHCADYLVEPDQPFRVTITVENRSRLPVMFVKCRCIVPTAAQLASSGRGTLVTLVNSSEYRFSCFLMPRQKLEHSFRLTISKRGGYYLAGLQLSTGDFLGLEESTEEFPGHCSVVILPKKPDPNRYAQILGGLMGDRSVNRWIHEDPVLSAGFREYTGREPLKTISWNRSLQSSKLMVRQMDHTAEKKLTVLLSMNAGTWNDREVCFSLCRGICEELTHQGISFAFLHNGMLLTSVGILPPLESSMQNLPKILEGLGRAVPDVNGSLSALVHRALAREQSSGGYLLITPGITNETRQYAKLLERRSGSIVTLISGEADT